jgi:hypothetical protein
MVSGFNPVKDDRSDFTLAGVTLHSDGELRPKCGPGACAHWSHSFSAFAIHPPISPCGIHAKRDAFQT